MFEPLEGHRLEIGRAVPRGKYRPTGGIEQSAWMPFDSPNRFEIPFSVAYFRDDVGRVELVTYAFCIDLSWPWWRPWTGE